MEGSGIAAKSNVGQVLFRPAAVKTHPHVSPRVIRVSLVKGADLRPDQEPLTCGKLVLLFADAVNPFSVQYEG